MARRPRPHAFTDSQLAMFGGIETCARCGLPRVAAVHTDAPGRTPLARNAGETQRESQEGRARGWQRRAIYELVVAHAVLGDPACDYDLFVESGFIWNTSTANRNSLALDGLIAPIPDTDGKRHPLKIKIGGRRVTVADGPWRVKHNPRGPDLVLVWAPTDGPFGAFVYEEPW